MRRIALTAALVLAATFVCGGAVLAQPQPEFKYSFKALADQIPGIVGVPLEEEHREATGDIVQRTTTGLMVWRASDRWTLFTNGSVTWILGPFGIQSRLNTQLYPWEWVPPAPAAAPTSAVVPGPSLPEPAPTPFLAQPPAPPPTATPLPPPPAPVPPPTAVPVSSLTYIPDVRGMDDAAGGHGVMVKSFLLEIDQEWARVWGWRPHRPTTVYLYTDGGHFANGYAQITGTPMSWWDLDRMSSFGAVARGNDTRTGGWAIFVNLNYKYGTEDWEPTIKALVLHEYAYIFQIDQAGDAGPMWFREGFAQWATNFKLPGTPAEKAILYYAGIAQKNGTLPSLMTLNSSWDSIVSVAGPDSEAAYGASYLAVKYLAGRVGGMPLLMALKRAAAAGEPFDTALQNATGYSIERLESEYRGTIPSP